MTFFLSLSFCANEAKNLFAQSQFLLFRCLPGTCVCNHIAHTHSFQCVIQNTHTISLCVFSFTPSFLQAHSFPPVLYGKMRVTYKTATNVHIFERNLYRKIRWAKKELLAHFFTSPHFEIVCRYRMIGSILGLHAHQTLMTHEHLSEPKRKKVYALLSFIRGSNPYPFRYKKNTLGCHLHASKWAFGGKSDIEYHFMQENHSIILLT